MAEWVNDFEFPFELPAAGIELGHRVSELIVNANNPGDVPCPLRVEFTASATVANPYLLNITTGEVIRINRSMASGDQLVITTDTGAESITLVQGRVKANAFNYFDYLTSEFFQLAVGDNYLRYGADSGMDSLEMAVYYTPRYMGA